MINQDLIEEFMEEVETIAGEFEDDDLPAEDLIQEGYVGLLRAVNALEEGQEETADRGLFLSQYIRDAIREAMEKAIAENRKARMSDDRLVLRVELLNRSIERLTEELGTKPNIDEIANDMKITQDEVIAILKLTGETADDDALRPPKP